MTNQQLKAHCEYVIANPQDHLDWVVDMARVTLASLGAVPVVVRCRYHPTPQCDGKWIYIPQAEYIKDETGMYQEQALYISPLLQELKPIELVKELPDNSKESQDYRVGFAMGYAKYAEGMVKNIRAAGYEVKV